ncbi:hypothetical protein [Terrabacter sp. Soil810]|uniref:hypothetical protein n=1 Tax=Terrabacter sp. Soil810 TaxID=1736418 RepID=UPI000A5B77AD|nr:hypothetical protein [Terrabacter sp. Soil810]
MAWWDWSDPSFTLALLGAMAGVGAAVLAIVVPRQIHNASQQGERIAQDTQRQLIEVQRLQLEAVRRSRWERLLDILPTTGTPAVFYALRNELENYHGEERDLLEGAARANPIQHLPSRVDTLREALDYVKSLPNRVTPANHMFPEHAKRFASGCAESFDTADFERLGLAVALVTCFPPGRTPGVQFYRELVNDVSWRLADDLLYSTRDLEPGGHAANVITGVLLAAKDIHTGRAIDSEEEVEDGIGLFHRGYALRSRSGWPDGSQDQAVFDSNLKAAIASLLSNELSNWGQWPREGLTDSQGAAAAWIIRAAGEVAVGDEHLEMRIIQHLPWMVRSLSGHARAWGSDVDDVRHGLALLRRRCPGLWDEYGTSLVDCTGVSPGAEDGARPLNGGAS